MLNHKCREFSEMECDWIGSKGESGRTYLIVVKIITLHCFFRTFDNITLFQRFTIWWIVENITGKFNETSVSGLLSTRTKFSLQNLSIYLYILFWLTLLYRIHDQWSYSWNCKVKYYERRQCVGRDSLFLCNYSSESLPFLEEKNDNDDSGS